VVRFANNGTLIEMTGPIELPPELHHFADLLSEQPPEVRDLFRYALVLAMIDDEKARVNSRHLESPREMKLAIPMILCSSSPQNGSRRTVQRGGMTGGLIQ
jgi:hypothetical protein